MVYLFFFHIYNIGVDCIFFLFTSTSNSIIVNFFVLFLLVFFYVFEAS